MIKGKLDCFQLLIIIDIELAVCYITTMIYTVEFTKQAAKSLRKLPANARNSIIKKVEEFAKDPFAPQHDVEKMQGSDGYRLRVGNWRIIYDLYKHQLLIVVIKIGNRKEVYK